MSMKALFTAATGMEAQQTRISVISNNLANMNTTGFKTSRAEFQDLIYQIVQAPGSQTSAANTAPGGIQIGSGVKTVSTPILMTQGTLEQTGRSLDVAIEGRGFFKVTTPSGEAYTRAGSLSINSDLQLVNQDGYLITPNITLQAGATDLSIGTDGTVSGRVPPDSATIIFGTISTYSFPNEAGLQSAGKNLFLETTASGSPTEGAPGDAGLGTLQGGFLESSNVNIAEELIRMILSQRAFELNSKVIQTSDQMLASANQVR